ncbi:MAG TPA: hypothetical protein VJ872_14230 [Nocardioides sp.]|nr:hypothetical protein [Nocardioides sp.]
MSREELREQLARLADTAPVASVPADTYRRGRRATTRARLGAGAVAAACLVLASALGTQLLGHSPKADDVGTSPASPGVPDHIWAPPYAIPATSDFKVGRAAAAYVDTRGQVMVVGSDNGRYHRLALPATDAARAHPVVALAPDGRHLAAVRTLQTSVGGYRSDIIVVDLTTGGARYVLPRGGREDITTLAWSSDGSYLAWQGVEVNGWTIDEYHPTGTYQVGTLRMADGKTRQALTLGAGADTIRIGARSYSDERPRPLAVSTSGQVALVAGNTLWLDGRTQRVAMRVSDAGSDVVSAIWFDRSGVVGTLYFGRGSDATIGSLTDATRRSSLGVQVPAYRGLLANGQVLVQPDGASTYAGTTTVGVVAYRPGVALGARPVIAVNPHVTQLSVATELMAPGAHTVPWPRPDWPWSTPHRLAVFVGLPLALVGLAAAGWRWRRRRLTHL